MIDADLKLTEAVITFTRNEEVNSTTYIHQTDSGTIFFRQNDTLWVRHNDQKVEAKLLGGFNYSIMAAQGDAIYYGSMWKRMIYKAVLTGSGNIECTIHRQMIEGENLHQGGMCSIARDGQVYIHRICDDPLKVQLHVHVTIDVFKHQELKGQYGDSAIFRQIVIEPISPVVKTIGDNALSLVCFRGEKRRFLETRNVIKDMRDFYTSWGSPAAVKSDYVYMTNGKSLLVVDPIKGTLLPPLKFSGVSAFHIAGIHDGVLSGRGKCDKSGKYYFMTAQLPTEYLDKPDVDPTEQEPKSGTFSSDFCKNYTVKEIIGEGGFGCVFKVVDKLDNWEYAVKRIAVRPVLMEATLWEARVMAQLQHPGIVEYKGTWKEEPPEGWQHESDAALLRKMKSKKRNLGHFNSNDFFIYIKLQLCNHSLHDWLKNNHEQSCRYLPKMKLWFKQMVSAVAYIHGKNLFHRDLKPSNILFAADDVVKLCDLGIAAVRKEEEDNRQSIVLRTVVGTWTYMSPEQLNGKYSSPTDVFALGLILAEMSLSMTEAERDEIFNNYRLGQQCDRIDNARTKEFIAILTQVDPEDRPTCMEIQNHLFIASIVL